jgi:hypothetical protein
MYEYTYDSAQLDFWTETRGLNIPVDIRVPADNIFLKDHLLAKFTSSSIMIEDLQR